jgi:hypothetical protein
MNDPMHLSLLVLHDLLFILIQADNLHRRSNPDNLNLACRHTTVCIQNWTLSMLHNGLTRVRCTTLCNAASWLQLRPHDARHRLGCMRIRKETRGVRLNSRECEPSTSISSVRAVDSGGEGARDAPGATLDDLWARVCWLGVGECDAWWACSAFDRFVDVRGGDCWGVVGAGDAC